MSRPLQNVHVRINDKTTGQPTPCRVRFTDSEGNYYAPFGRLAEFAIGRNQDVGGNLLLGMKPHAYIDGGCEIALPTGNLRVEIAKGLEYVPRNLEVSLGAGKLALRLEIERWIDMRKQGWYSGDGRVHFITPHAALLEAQAEDVAVVNLLATECQVPGSYEKNFLAIPNLLAFSGQDPCLGTAEHMVVVNTHNRHPVLGSLGLLNCHRVVYPLSFGPFNVMARSPDRAITSGGQVAWPEDQAKTGGRGEGPTDGKDNWTLAAWCNQCHRKQGLVVWTQTLHESPDFLFGEPLADLILGKVDAFEIDTLHPSPLWGEGRVRGQTAADSMPHWYTLLNAGLAIPLLGASGKDSNGIALGTMRTYAHLLPGESFTYKNWIEAVRTGRTFITNGPLLTLTVNGQEPGKALRLEDGTKKVQVRAEAQSQVPFQHLEIVANGRVLAAASAGGNPCSACLEMELEVPDGGWIAARCRGKQQLPGRPANQRVFAHTSPIYLRIHGKPSWTDPAARHKLDKELAAMLAWVHAKARCDTEAQREKLAEVFREARQKLGNG